MHAPNAERVVSDIRRLVAGGDLDEAMGLLQPLAQSVGGSLANESVLLAGRLAQATRQARQGLLSAEETQRQWARLADAILQVVGDVERRLEPAGAPVAAPAFRGRTEGLKAPALEKIIGINNLRQIAWLDRGVQVSRAVCRVLTPDGLGSGFQIAPGVLMTNNHVIPSPEVAKQSKAEFNYQMTFSGDASNTVRYDLDPDRFFRTSPSGELDYTVVAVRAPAASGATAPASWGTLALNSEADPVPGEHVIIVQHPNGAPKQIVLTANAVLAVSSPLLHYSTDTMAGSSGSPVFNDLWQVIAIHHAAGPAVAADDGIARPSNEGILMSAVMPHLGDGWK